ncbi:MAG: insulinase family protein [Notoacmeibacter sp.]|nr:insulinase family protein [Notoacmeibacter sp.]MCC0032563.1 insulinase family protein [Brucellaceae bacterium]
MTNPKAKGLSAFFLLVVLVAASPVLAAVKVQSVTSPKGVTAWLVEDYSVPIVTVRFSFRGGTTQDPAGKEGMSNLITGLFDEGAGDMDSDAFQEALEDSGAEMSFSEGADSIEGSFRTLAETRDQSVALLKLAVNSPRFDQAPVDRIRDQIVSGIESEARDPSTIAKFAWNENVYSGHPYARRSEGTPETLAAITPADLKAFHKAQFARANLHVGVVGAIDPEALKALLDDVFGGLPEKPEQMAVTQATPKFGQNLAVDYDLPQTTIRLAFPGLKRSDPDFYAAYVMNHILGGGSFTSRLYTEVREKRGLAYGINSWLSTRDYSNELQISTATRSDRAAETLQVIRDEVAKMAAEGPTQQELDEAKKYIINSYAVANFDSSSSIAETLVAVQEQDLGITYFEDRERLIGQVTLDQAKAEAVKLLSATPVIMLVGPQAAPETPKKDG